MNSNSKATSRQSKNSRIQTGQTSLVYASAKAITLVRERALDDLDHLVTLLRLRSFDTVENRWIRGLKKGASWVGESATGAELRRLEYARGIRNWNFGVSNSVYSDAERFYFIIRPSHEGSTVAAAGFWGVNSGFRNPISEYVQGFTEGAMNVWNVVKAQVNLEDNAI